MLDTYTHVINEWRGRRAPDIEAEIRRARLLAEDAQRPWSLDEVALELGEADRFGR